MLTLKLKLQYSGHLMGEANSLEKTLMLGKIEGRRRRGQQRMIWLDDIIDSMYMSLRKLWKMVDREAWRAAVHWVTKNQTQLSDWTTVALLALQKGCFLLVCQLYSSSPLTIPTFSHSSTWIIWCPFIVSEYKTESPTLQPWDESFRVCWWATSCSLASSLAIKETKKLKWRM